MVCSGVLLAVAGLLSCDCKSAGGMRMRVGWLLSSWLVQEAMQFGRLRARCFG